MGEHQASTSAEKDTSPLNTIYLAHLKTDHCPVSFGKIIGRKSITDKLCLFITEVTGVSRGRGLILTTATGEMNNQGAKRQHDGSAGITTAAGNRRFWQSLQNCLAAAKPGQQPHRSCDGSCLGVSVRAVFHWQKALAGCDKGSENHPSTQRTHEMNCKNLSDARLCLQSFPATRMKEKHFLSEREFVIFNVNVKLLLVN